MPIKYIWVGMGWYIYIAQLVSLRSAALVQVFLPFLQSLFSMGNVSEVALILRFYFKLGQKKNMVIFM